MDRLELIQVDVNYNYSERLEGERSKTNIYIFARMLFCLLACYRGFYDEYFLIAMWNDLVNLKRSERVKWCKVPYFDLLKR